MKKQKLRKTWGFTRCNVCRAFTLAKFSHCEHCKAKQYPVKSKK